MARKKKGSLPAETRPVVTVPTSRCTKCGSTDRERYYSTVEQAYRGLDRHGNAFTHIIRRWTRCKSCGQARIDRTYENRVEPATL